MHLIKVPGVSACLLLTLLLPFNIYGQGAGTNSWTKPTSGNWEEPYWSLGQIPNHNQDGVTFNNPGWKALAIGANTSANFPGSLWIKNLLVESPTDSANQLLLNYAGLAVPLRIDADLRVIGANSSLLSYYSALRAGSFYLGGVATFDQLSDASFSQVDVGMDGGPGQLNLLGGFIRASSVAVNSQSTLNVSNGCILNAGGLSLNLPATGGVAIVNVSGSLGVSNAIDIGWGNITMSGGYFQTPGITVFQGELRQSGGSNDSGAIRLPQGRLQNGQGTYYLSGGLLLSSTLSLGDALPGGFTYYNGVFEQTGGVHTNSGGITTWGVIRQAAHSISGTYRLRAGSLVTPFLQEMEGGGFEQSGGINRMGTIGVADVGSFVLSGGSLSSSNTSIGSRYGRYFYWSDLQSVYTQTGGSHSANQFSSAEGGVAQLQGGSLTAPSISVGPVGTLVLSGAAVTNSGTFTILTAAHLFADGNYPQLGKLIVGSAPTSPNFPPPSSDSILNFGANATTLRFRDSRDVPWDSQLEVSNWSGSVNGGGTHRLYVGTSSQGLTQDQLARIRFVNPAGLRAGSYSAAILATGEVVPNSGQIAGTNSWIKPSSGNWEDPSAWSLGVLPSSSQSVLLANSNWKAVGITATTARNFPASMTVGSVTVRGAWDTFNTLLLQYAGTDVPLRVLNGVTVADMARILNFDSALVVQSGTIVVTNAQIVQDGGLIRTTNSQIRLQNAQYHLTNGVFEGGEVWIGSPVSGSFNQYGGTAVIAKLTFGPSEGSNSGGGGGTYSLYGGDLSLPNGLRITGDHNSSSSYFQAGGTNRTPSIFLEPGFLGYPPGFTLNGGLLADNYVDLIGDDFGGITLQQNGGTHIVSNLLYVAGGARHGGPRPSEYHLNGGTLSTPNINLDGHPGDALLIQTNGITRAGQIGGRGYWAFSATVSLSGGTMNCSNLFSSDGSYIYQSGGTLVVSNTLSFGGFRDTGTKHYSQYAFTGGTLIASNIDVSGDWIIGDSSGTPRITNPGTCSLSHTLRIGNAVEQLGRFILAGDATIDLAGSASRLSFANSSAQSWAGTATLLVVNWNGNLSGGGPEQLKFGNNQSGLTPAQLSQIRFQAGSSSNFYSAKILSTGEVVPDHPIGAPVAFWKQGNNLVLSWPSGWYLQSSTNVVGPYLDITGATSPYTYDTTAGPQRFFRLRQ